MAQFLYFWVPEERLADDLKESSDFADAWSEFVDSWLPDSGTLAVGWHRNKCKLVNCFEASLLLIFWLRESRFLPTSADSEISCHSAKKNEQVPELA